MRVPSGVILAVLGSDPRRRAIGAAKHGGAAHLTACHVKRLGGRVDDVVDRLHGEVEGHEFDDRPEPGKGSTDPDASEAIFGDRSIDDAVWPELVEHALADLVGPLILANF